MRPRRGLPCELLARPLRACACLGERPLVLEQLAGCLGQRGHVSSRNDPACAEAPDGLAEATDPVTLRVAYRRCLLSIAARDVCGTIDVAETAAELADLAIATLRAALAGFAGSPDAAERALAGAGIDPSLRGERLAIEDFARVAEQLAHTIA